MFSYKMKEETKERKICDVRGNWLVAYFKNRLLQDRKHATCHRYHD